MSTITTRAASFVAYDYTAQKWVDGTEAIRLRLTQLVADVSILCSDEGERYFAFTKPKNSTGTIAQAVANRLGALHDLVAMAIANNAGCELRGDCIVSEITQAQEAIELVRQWEASR